MFFFASTFSILNLNDDFESSEINVHRSIYLNEKFQFYIKTEMQDLCLWKIFIRDFIKWEFHQWKSIDNVIMNFVEDCCYINELWIEDNDIIENWIESIMFIAHENYYSKWSLNQIIWIEINYDVISLFIEWRKKIFIDQKKKNKRKTTIFQIINQSNMKKLVDFSIVTIDQKQQINSLILIDTERFEYID